MRRRAGTLAAALATSAALVLSGCSALSGGAYDVALPGGADVGDDPWTLDAEFSDVLDLVPQSSVKVDDVAVGRVARIRLAPDGRSAVVSMTVREGLRLPVGTTARLQQTSLLGEKYVALVRPGEESDPLPGQSPDQAPAAPDGVVPAASTPGADEGSGDADGDGYLDDGATLSLATTSQAVGVEQVLGALSMLLNGGGLGQFQEISRELQAVSEGRPEEIRAWLDQTNQLVAGLDARRDSITTAIDGLAQLSATLEGERPRIDRALDGLEPGLAVLRDQRAQLVTMLEALDRLSTVSVRVLDRAQDDIVADLKRIRPILARLADAGDSLPGALEVLFTFPFPDSVLGAIRGDYLNVFATANLATPGGVLLQPSDPNDVSGAATAAPGATSRSTTLMLLPPTSSAVPGLDSPTITLSPSGTPRPSGSPTRTPSTAPTTKPPGTSVAPPSATADPDDPDGQASSTPDGDPTTSGSASPSQEPTRSDSSPSTPPTGGGSPSGRPSGTPRVDQGGAR